MQWFNRMKIGSKVAMASGLGMLLVLSLVGGTFFMLRSVDEAVTSAKVQSEVARLVTGVKESLQTLRIAGRDLRLATTTDKVAEAKKAADDELVTMTKMVDAATALMVSQDKKDRAAKLLSEATEYHVQLGELARLVEIEINTNVGISAATPQRQALIDGMSPIATAATSTAQEAIDAGTTLASEKVRSPQP